MKLAEAENSGKLESIHPENREAFKNLIHYMVLRHDDLRELQTQLTSLGLSSLGRSESCVMHNMSQVIARLGETHEHTGDALSSAAAEKILGRNTRNLLGQKPHGRREYIMVTAPDTAEANTDWMRACMGAGMNLLRINCAHGNSVDWHTLIENLRRAEKETGMNCRVVMDMAGPKIRTTQIAGGAEVFHIRPEKDFLGRVIKSAIVPLTGGTVDTPDGLPFPKKFLSKLHNGDKLIFADTRGRKRKMKIRGSRGRVHGVCSKPAYIGAGTVFQLIRNDKIIDHAECGKLPFIPAFITLKPGDPLTLVARDAPGVEAVLSDTGEILTPARIGCTLPEALTNVKAGEHILFDDGKIEAVIESVRLPEIQTKVTRAKPGGSRLRGEKGINLPESDLPIPVLSEKDIEDFEFIRYNADIVSASFVRSAEDVSDVLNLLKKNNTKLGLILKIETRRGFENLPRILLKAFEAYPLGIMIARGDLAVECGFERLAEIQEEMLWICEAALNPVIWATQVLENHAQTGMASRAEITDAAMSVRAECVMLNKGPYIVQTLQLLSEILKKMEQHQHKKTTLFRSLHVSL